MQFYKYYGEFEKIVVVTLELSFFGSTNYFYTFRFCSTKVIPFIGPHPHNKEHKKMVLLCLKKLVAN